MLANTVVKERLKEMTCRRAETFKFRNTVPDLP